MMLNTDSYYKAQTKVGVPELLPWIYILVVNDTNVCQIIHTLYFFLCASVHSLQRTTV
jgi:hypothetical protein